MFDFLSDEKRKIIIEHPELGKPFFAGQIDKKIFIENLHAFARDLCNKELDPKIRFRPREVLMVIKAVESYPSQKWIGDIMALEDNLKSKTGYIGMLERTIGKLTKRKEEVEVRLNLAWELWSATKSADVEREIVPLRSLLQGYQSQRKALPKNWRGRIKDTAKYDELTGRIQEVKQRIRQIPEKARESEKRLADLHRQFKEMGVTSSDYVGLFWKIQREVWELDKQKFVCELQLINIRDYNLGQAYAIFGNEFYGPAHYNLRFNATLGKEQVPSLPDLATMQKAKDLGMIMAIRIYDDGKPSEWKFFSKDILPETTDKMYIEQTRAMRNYLKRHGLLKRDEETQCTDDRLSEIEKLLQSDPAEAAFLLTNLLVNKRHRHSYDDICYFTHLTTIEDEGGSVHLGGKKYSRLFNSDHEVTNTPVIARDRKIGNVLVATHLQEQRGPNRDEMPVSSNKALGFGGYYKQGIRMVF